MLKRLLAPSGLKVALMLTFLMLFLNTFQIMVFCIPPSAEGDAAERAREEQGIVSWALCSALSPVTTSLSLMDKKWVDIILKNREVQPHSEDVVIATIDTKSVDKYGRWPWPRSRMAEMVTALNEHYEVLVVGFDIVFSEPEHNTGLKVTEQYEAMFSSLRFPTGAKTNRFLSELNRTKATLDGDGQFAKVVENSGNVVMGYFFFSSGNIEHLTPEDIAKSAELIADSGVSAVTGSIGRGAVPIGRAPEPNIPRLSNAGAVSGFFNMQPDPEDGTVRRVHLLMQFGEDYYPSLDLQVLKLAYGAQNITVHPDENGYILGIELSSPEQPGAKIILPNADGSILLNYKGPIGTFKHYSIYDIIEKKVPVEALRDKIVLVGATEVGIFDLRTTPVHVAYPGVEVHATLLDNILNDDYFRLDLTNDFYTVGLILLVGLILGFTLPNLKSVYGSILAIAMIAGYTVAHRYMVMDLYSWTSYVYILLTIALIWAGVTLFRFLVTDKDKRFIKGAFQQYLSPDVINQLMDNPDMLQLGGERRVMTAFFSDVQGFSTISEKLDPTELVALLNEYLTEMTDIVTEVDGTIDKYEGDAIIAFFGAPMPYDDHAIRACQVSLRMQTKLAEMRDMWREMGKPEDLMLYMRIGLNTGPMVVGNMGSQKRFDYTMMGNAVNLAARLEGANKNYGMFNCISEFTYEAAKDAIEAREVDLIRVMGITTPVRIYELVCHKGELTENQKKGFAYFAKGLELYRTDQFEEAIKYFKAVFKFIPDDPPSTKFIGRCEGYIKSPPPADWEGVYTATEK